MYPVILSPHSVSYRFKYKLARAYIALVLALWLLPPASSYESTGFEFPSGAWFSFTSKNPRGSQQDIFHKTGNGSLNPIPLQLIRNYPVISHCNQLDLYR